MSHDGSRDGLPELGFPGPTELAGWLAEHHATAAGIWLRCGKKGCPEPSVSYAQALDVALCWGWIDGQKAPGPAGMDHHYLQRFTPRRAGSRWSKVNVDKVAALTAAGRMQPPGLAQVEAAQADGRWAAAYAGARTAELPPDLAAALDAVPGARAAYDALTGSNRYAVLYRIGAVKRPATRARKVVETADKLAAGWTPHLLI